MERVVENFLEIMGLPCPTSAYGRYSFIASTDIGTEVPEFVVGKNKSVMDIRKIPGLIVFFMFEDAFLLLAFLLQFFFVFYECRVSDVFFPTQKVNAGDDRVIFNCEVESFHSRRVEVTV